MSVPYRSSVANFEASRGPQPYVARALAGLESDLRSLALLALGDWEQTGVVEPELFAALGSLQRPSWGTWNFVLQSLRNSRKLQLRAASPEVRSRIENARSLHAILAYLEESCDDELRTAAEPLAHYLGSKQRLRRIADVLTLPISVRNQIAHFPPVDDAGWQAAADALAPLVTWHAAHPSVLATTTAWPAPWFARFDDEVWAFNGVDKDFAVTYASPYGGRPRTSTEHGAQLVQSMQRLLGKTELQEQSFHRLLSRLAPDEIRGVIVGDFLVGAPVGRGGFATVHVGRQLSTGRKVAVKILRDGLSEDARLRFQQEAAFLSRLAHPSIVGVVSYGEDAWSVPRFVDLDGEPWFAELSRGAAIKTYIALEWIDGVTLEDLFRQVHLDKTQQPPALGVLREWFRQAAEALAAVHAAGLIHRDIKPGNLMLATDAQQIRLMDFGIARSEDDDRTIMTTVGVALGTPPYMSPEQLLAMAADAEVGPASDLYSLCATFYELATGHRLYEHDRESVESVKTRKLRGQAPARPRELVASLPWELETILLGGLATEVADRYRSAEALATDLRHWERDEPIEYRRPSLARRARLGYRRHRAIVISVGAFVALAAVGLVLYIRGVEAQRAIAEDERRRALESRADAEDLLGFMLVDLRDKLQPLGRLDLLESTSNKSIAYYARRPEVATDGERSRRAIALRNLGDVLSLRGRRDDARKQYEASLAISRDLVGRGIDVDANELAVCETLRKLGAMQSMQGGTEIAASSYETAYAIAFPRASAPHASLAWRRELAVIYHRLGERDMALRQWGDALTQYRSALALRQRIANEAPRDADAQEDLSQSWEMVGWVQELQGELASALSAYRTCLQIDEDFARQQPDHVAHRRRVALDRRRIADVLVKQGQRTEGIAMLRSAIAMLEDLARADPTNVTRRADIADVQHRLAEALLSDYHPEEALVAFRSVLAAREARATHDPSDADARRAVAHTQTQIGDVLRALERYDEALAAYRAGLAIDERLVASDPAHVSRRRDISVDHYKLARTYQDKGDAAAALAEARVSLALNEKLVAEHPGNAEDLHDISTACTLIGEILVATDARAAVTYLERALAIDDKLVHESKLGTVEDLVVDHDNLGEARLKIGDLDGAERDYRASLAIEEQLAARSPDDADQLGDVAESHVNVATVLEAKHDRAGALARYRTALELARQAAKGSTSANHRERITTVEAAIARLTR